MVSINMAMEIDLTGQVCADSSAEKFYSGIGGQVDFNRGAAKSQDGKAIIVLSATDEKEKKSRIVARLSQGAGVVITRGDVHYVVSEHGVAYLHGKSVEERALALISIAHPDFRKELFEEAIATKLIRKEHAEVESGFVLAATEYKKALLLEDGVEIYLRPIRPTDEQGIKNLVYSLSQETLYYRFMSHTKHFGTKQILDFVYVDHRSNVTVVATIPEAHGEDIIGVGRYFLDPRTNRAEVAFVVRDDWQGKGIGKFLFRQLVVIAKKNGIAGLTAEVLRRNRGMQALLNKCGYKVKSTLEEDLYHFQIDF
jgi:GNAT superfamily N-acetyltransferase